MCGEGRYVRRRWCLTAMAKFIVDKLVGIRTSFTFRRGGMSKKIVFVVSTLAATTLLLVVLAGIALAKGDAALSNAPAAPSAVYTPTLDYWPKKITTLGEHTITYLITVHNQDPSITPTARITLTLDPNLDFADPAIGTVTFPGDTIILPTKQVIWTPTLTPCQPQALGVFATATIETVKLPYKAYTTTVEWNGESEDLVTELDLAHRLYCPVIMLNVAVD
jgi:hypothetical protein